MRLTLLISLLASLLLAGDLNLSTPLSTLQHYHKAIQEGDISTLKRLMVEESFDTDMEIYALSIALQDKDFHTILKEYAQNAQARDIVQKAVAKKLKARKSRIMTDTQSFDIGDDRVMIRFLEDGKKKQLYLSKEAGQWKINYKAGRKTRH